MIIKTIEAPRFMTTKAATYFCGCVRNALYGGYSVSIDMRHVEAIDATGLRELVNCSVLATHKNVELKIVEPSKNAQAIIELTRIDYLLPFIQRTDKQEQESESPIVMTLMTALFCVYVVLMIYAFFNGFD